MRCLFALIVLSTLCACTSSPIKEPPLPTPVAVYTGEKSLSDNVVEYKPILKPPPEYPRELLEKGIEGWVVVEYTILPNGLVGDVRVTDESPKSVFSSPALDAVKMFQYQPRLENGNPVAVRGVTTVISFAIE